MDARSCVLLWTLERGVFPPGVVRTRRSCQGGGRGGYKGLDLSSRSLQHDLSWVARSRNQRILPPSGEPGLWAADEPHAAVRRPPAPPVVTVDELLVATPSPGAPAAKGCRERLLRASRTSGREEARRNLPRTPRECLTARLLIHCVSSQSREVETQAVVTPKAPGVDFVAAHLREVETILFWQMRRCEGVLSLPNLEIIFSDIVVAFDRQRPTVAK
jgi:hypothetical protein